MENHFKYESVPSHFAHCFNGQCVKSNSCLRHLAAEHCTAAHPIIRTINPLCVPDNSDTCPYFRPLEKIRIAWGIKHLFDRLPYTEAKLLKSQIMARFGKTMYYRYYRKEYGVSPENQEFIRRVFSKKGIAEEPAFEYYSEEYIWD